MLYHIHTWDYPGSMGRNGGETPDADAIIIIIIITCYESTTPQLHSFVCSDKETRRIKVDT